MVKTYQEDFRIRSYQADVNNHLKPTALLELMQEMAGAHAEMLNIGHCLLDEHGLVWVLTRMEVRMERWPLAQETITVTTFPMANRRWFFPRYFIFRDAQGQQIGCAGSLWVLMDVHDRKMAKPDIVAPLMPDNSDLTAPFGMPATVEEVVAEAAVQLRNPVYTDLDVNGHVNNTRYLDWCCNALGIDLLRRKQLSVFAVNFHQEILPGQELRTELRCDGDRFSFSGFEGDKRHFDVGGQLTALT